MYIIDGLISRRIVDVTKAVTISCQEQTLKTSLHELLVWWKRHWHRVKSNEVQDGMQVVCLYERPYVHQTLDHTWFLHGMSLYQEYDETLDTVQTYLYKFPKDEETIQQVNTFLGIHALPVQVVTQGRFVSLQGVVGLYDTQKMHVITLTHAGIGGLLSFLLGLVVVYGTLDIQDGILHTIHMRIPLVGSIVQHQSLIEYMVAALRDKGMYIHIDVQNQKYGQTIQCKITDWEILALLTHRLAETYHIVQVSKYSTYQNMKSDLMNTIREETGVGSIGDKIEYGVVKLLRK